ncbi:23S rRNA (guanosine(2251)-2'-O)-methyltransferase RlmB [uncultured Aquimonas sp.]|uniref:23S rRNA (guanosine(2251)-2'-O)-methyltransferase RlmB n=1 Tax=uncultured Aquimonas sp. TaxID=385483 RepID=UPI00086EB100|nr:23S rRNA (guanosine(2251)-2'-O)-methyltransferase RlmB [uncultured Aquimonas sp.]ODU43779.1 MAG: 23S rRNA (guanosine(2251)-2'-O)-methyltransferase RlmB [Xanthomonadaceae bacterium SCN 69-123]
MSDWIAGINAVAAALEAGQDLAEVLIDGKAKNPRLAEIGSAAKSAGIALRFVPLDQIERQAAGARHQGVIARVQSTRIYDERDLEGLIEAAAKPLLLILDGVQDPHNLGACLRSAAAAGATAVIVPKDRAATLTPTARKVAAGGAERVPLVRVTNLARCMKELQDAGIWIVGLAGEAEASLYSVDLKGPMAIAMGGEGEGLRRLTREHCDYLAKIPMASGMESLNVSVAAGISLFEALRQRG